MRIWRIDSTICLYQVLPKDICLSKNHKEKQEIVLRRKATEYQSILMIAVFLQVSSAPNEARDTLCSIKNPIETTDMKIQIDNDSSKLCPSLMVDLSQKQSLLQASILQLTFSLLTKLPRRARSKTEDSFEPSRKSTIISLSIAGHLKYRFFRIEARRRL